MTSPLLISLFLLGLIASSNGYAMVRVGRSDPMASFPLEIPSPYSTYYLYESKPVFKRQISANWFNPRDYYMSDEFERDLREQIRARAEEEARLL